MWRIQDSSKMLAIIKVFVSDCDDILCYNKDLIEKGKNRLFLSIPFAGFGSRVSTVGCSGRVGM